MSNEAKPFGAVTLPMPEAPGDIEVAIKPLPAPGAVDTWFEMSIRHWRSWHLDSIRAIHGEAGVQAYENAEQAQEQYWAKQPPGVRRALAAFQRFCDSTSLHVAIVWWQQQARTGPRKRYVIAFDSDVQPPTTAWVSSVVIEHWKEIAEIHGGYGYNLREWLVKHEFIVPIAPTEPEHVPALAIDDEGEIVTADEARVRLDGDDDNPEED